VLEKCLTATFLLNSRLPHRQRIPNDFDKNIAREVLIGRMLDQVRIFYILKL
jgi:hypothetical protein